MRCLQRLRSFTPGYFASSIEKPGYEELTYESIEHLHAANRENITTGVFARVNPPINGRLYNFDIPLSRKLLNENSVTEIEQYVRRT